MKLSTICERRGEKSPKIYFHGANIEHLQSIISYGLKAPVYLTSSEETALLYSRRWAYDDNDLLPDKVVDTISGGFNKYENREVPLVIIKACIVEVEINTKDTSKRYDEDLFFSIHSAMQDTTPEDRYKVFRENIPETIPDSVYDYMISNLDKSWPEAKKGLIRILKNIKVTNDKFGYGAPRKNILFHRDIKWSGRSAIKAVYILNYYAIVKREDNGIAIFPNEDQLEYGKIMKVIGDGSFKTGNEIIAGVGYLYDNNA